VTGEGSRKIPQILAVETPKIGPLTRNDQMTPLQRKWVTFAWGGKKATKDPRFENI
jgi:hypothetical protein